MSKFTRRNIFTVLSVAYLAALTVLAAYAFHQANYFSLPIAQTLPALAVALPTFAGIAYESVLTFHREQRGGTQAVEPLQTSTVFQAVNAVLLVYETVLATLAGTHISGTSGGGGVAECGLRGRWEEMNSARDATGIRRIQDAFDCCGFKSPVDHPWPFKGGDVTDKTCMVRFDRTSGCFEGWKGEERKVAIMLMIVPIGVFVWKVLMVLAPNMGAPWLPSAIRLTDDRSGNQNSRTPLAIEELGDEEEVRNEVAEGNRDVDNAMRIEGSRVHASPLFENERWRST